MNTFFKQKAPRALGWFLVSLIMIYFILLVTRMIHFSNQDRIDTEVVRIHNSKISLSDVIKENLPQESNTEADKTIAGADTNLNGIRDDVELAIVSQYPDSMMIRAVLLQYAHALQMETQLEIVSTETVTETTTEESRGISCIADTLVPRESRESFRTSENLEKINTYVNFVEAKQFNTEARKQARRDFLKNMRSFGDSTNQICDINISNFQN